MKKIYANMSLPIVYNVKNLLDSAGIETQLRNENLVSSTVPIAEMWPEVWVNDEDEERAMKIIEETDLVEGSGE